MSEYFRPGETLEDRFGHRYFVIPEEPSVLSVITFARANRPSLVNPLRAVGPRPVYPKPDQVVVALDAGELTHLDKIIDKTLRGEVLNAIDHDLLAGILNRAREVQR